MKNVKKILACALAVIMLLPMHSAMAAQNSQLRFTDDGGFRIMLVSDVQDIRFTSKFFLSAFNAVLDDEAPDMVILLGDQLEAWRPCMKLGDADKNAADAIRNIVTPMVQRNIPFAVVLGNHDAESGLSRERLIELYRDYPNCLAVDEGECMPGAGTYNLLVYDADGKTPLVNLYLIDSLDYDADGNYACVSKEQIAWCSATAESLQAQYGKPIPAIAFQHIIVPEIYDTLNEVQKDTPGAVSRVGVGEAKYFSPESTAIISGAINEAPCPPAVNNGQFAAWEAQGDVFAAFFGHDHTNTFIIEHRGIDLVAVPGSTFCSYNDPDLRGVRMVELAADNIKAYRTRLVSFNDYLDISGLDALRYHLFATHSIPSVYKLGIIAAVVMIGAAALITAIIIRHKRRKRTAAQ